MTLTLTETRPTVHAVGNIKLYVEEQRLEGPRGEVRLTSAHFRVMRRLLQRPGVIVTISDLIGELYPDPDLEGEDAYASLRQVLMSLRQALMLIGAGSTCGIGNERSVGYFVRGKAA